MEVSDFIKKFPVLRSAYGGLTKSERRIADYMAGHATEVMEKTISDIAASTGSSEITVSRFCKKLGFSGLQEFKRNMAAELSTTETEEFHDIHSDDSCRDVATKIFNNISEGLQDTLSLLDYKRIDDAAEVLVRAHRIAIYGFGNSATVCRDIETRYLRLGLITQAYSDSHMMVTSAALISSRDAVIAISHTGESKELLAAISRAKLNGATIIVITSHARSPLAALADICLCGMGREVKYSSEAGSSRLIHMAMSDVLYTRIAMINHDAFHENMHKMRQEIIKMKE